MTAPNLNGSAPKAIQELKNHNRWVCWKYEHGDVKVPFQPGGAYRAKSTHASHWGSFESCSSTPDMAGVGFVLGDEFVGIDLDQSIDAQGNIKPWAAEIVKTIDSYAEISPSKTGIKIFARVDPEQLREITRNVWVIKKIENSKHNEQIELYAKERYFTTTGEHFPGSPEHLRDATEAFNQLIDDIAEYGEQTYSAKKLKFEPEPIPSEEPPEAFFHLLPNDEPLRECWQNGKKISQGLDSSGSALDWDLAGHLGQYLDKVLTLDQCKCIIACFEYGQFGSGKLRGHAARRRMGKLVAWMRDRAERWIDAKDEFEAIEPCPEEVRPSEPFGALAGLDLRDFIGLEPPEREFIIQDWLPKGCVSSLYGAGSVGKSLLLQQLMTSVAMGWDFMGLKVNKARVYGFFCEETRDEIWRRQVKINDALGLSMDDMPYEDLLYAPREGEDNNELVVSTGIGGLSTTDTYKQLIRYIKVHQIDLVVLDHRSHIFSGDENSRREATYCVNRLAHICKVTGCAILLVGHLAKSDESEFSGSTGWDASVRCRLLFDWLNKDGRMNCSTEARRLAIMKTNYSALDELAVIWENGAFKPYMAAEDHYIKENIDDAKETIRQALRSFLTTQTNTCASATSSTYIIKIMQKTGLTEDYSEPVLRAALESMIDENEIIESSEHFGRYRDRTRKIGLVLNDSEQI